MHSVEAQVEVNEVRTISHQGRGSVASFCDGSEHAPVGSLIPDLLTALAQVAAMPVLPA